MGARRAEQCQLARGGVPPGGHGTAWGARLKEHHHQRFFKGNSSNRKHTKTMIQTFIHLSMHLEGMNKTERERKRSSPSLRRGCGWREGRGGGVVWVGKEGGVSR